MLWTPMDSALVSELKSLYGCFEAGFGVSE